MEAFTFLFYFSGRIKINNIDRFRNKKKKKKNALMGKGKEFGISSEWILSIIIPFR